MRPSVSFLKDFALMIKHCLSFLLFYFLIVPCCAQHQKDTFQLNGAIDGIEEGKIYLNYYLDKENRLVKDSSAIQNGSFFFRNRLSEAMVGSIKLNRTNELDENFAFIFLEPAEMKINLKYKMFSKAHLTGSITQKQYEALESTKQSLSVKFTQELDLLNSEKDQEKRDSIKTTLSPYFAGLNRIDYSFFDTYPESLVTLFLLQYHFQDLPVDSLQLFFGRLPLNLQKHVIGKQVSERINRLKSGSVGSIAKGFTSIDNNGDSLRLTDFAGKYILLDFWASWCAPCRKGNPHLIKLYNKYKSKGFQIISISDDDNRPELWKKAIKNDSIGVWLHILRGLDKAALENGRKNDNDINKNYGVEVLPTKILINPRGVIIAKFEGEGEGLDRKLADIFD